jgi:hypothetical protein
MEGSQQEQPVVEEEEKSSSSVVSIPLDEENLGNIASPPLSVASSRRSARSNGSGRSERSGISARSEQEKDQIIAQLKAEVKRLELILRQ